MRNKKIVKRILLTGGGTGGSVSPLLAVVRELQNNDSLSFRQERSEGRNPLSVGDGAHFTISEDKGFLPAARVRNDKKERCVIQKSSEIVECEFLWIGTRRGMERIMVKNEHIKFKAIFSGKFRRYFSLRNFIDPFLIIIGFFQALAIQLAWRPDLVISAGSFVSAPVVWAAWILRVPVLIHQQDARPGLANKLMAPFARVITVTFKESLKHYGKKAVWTGNMVRELRINNYELRIKNKNNLPAVLVVGGGTGSAAINELIWRSLNKLIKFCKVIHITGKNKNPNYKLPPDSEDKQITNYQHFEFLSAEQMAEAYAAADIVVSRAGMGVLTELSYLGKPSILIPISDSHQEENAKIFKDKDAAIVLDQKKLTSEGLTENIKHLLDDEMARDKLSNNIKKIIKQGANEKIVEIIKNILI